MFGMLLNIIRNINKSIKKSVQNTKNKVELARAKSAGKEEEQRVKKEQAKRSKPTLGSAIGGIFAKAASAIEAIPVTLVSIKIIAIVLAITIFAIILFSALSALSNVLLQSTIAEASTSLGFTNPYLQSISQEQYIDSDGAYHTIIRKIKEDNSDEPDNPDDPDPDSPDPGVYTTDVELWLGLSDKEIYAYLEKAGFLDTSEYSTSEFIHAANWIRAVRMAYRICYVTRDGSSNERVFRGLEPEVLLGMMPFEKSDAWLGISASYSFSETTEWIYFAPDGSISGDSLYEKYFRDYSVDNHYSDLFNRSNGYGNFTDGPLSYSNFTNNFDTWFITGLESSSDYIDAYDTLLMYKEYSGFSSFLPAEKGSSFKTSGVAIKTLFYSMFFVAMNYDNGFANGGTKYWGGGLASNSDGSFSAGKANVVNQFIYNTSDMFWGQLEDKYLYGADQDSGDIIGVLMCARMGYSSVDDISYEARYAMTKQLINCLYYPSFHHLPTFGASYESTLAPDLGFEYSAKEDYYAAILILTFAVVSEADGNVNNWGLREVRETHNVTHWVPWNSAGRDAYKFIGSGYYTQDDADTTDYGFDSLKEKVSTYYSTYEYNLAVITDDVFNIKSTSNTLMRYIIYSKFGGDHGESFIGMHEISDFLEPLTFPSSHTGFYGNLHNMNVEGYMAVIAGGDISYQLLDFILTYSGSSVQPVDPPADTGILADDYMLSTVLSRAEPILMGGSAYTLGSGGSFSSSIQRMYLPLVDMDNTKDGYNAYKGSGDGDSSNDQSYSGIIITQPIGEYVGGNAHNGLDFFGVGNAGTNGTSDEMTSVFNSYAPYTKNNWIDSDSFHNADAFKEGTTKSERTGVISIADGYIVKVHFNKTTVDKKDGWCLGNCVFVKHEIACGTTKKDIYIAYAHLSPDAMLVLAESLEAQGTDSSQIVEAYMNEWDGKNVEKHLDGLQIPIKQGTLIGFAGLTGATQGTHLHFAAYDMAWSHYWETSNGAYDYGATTSYILLGAMAYGKTVGDTITYPICSTWVDYVGSSPKGFGDLGTTTSGQIWWYLANLETAIAKAKEYPLLDK